MAARNKPAGIRSLVYGMGKGKGGIEGLSVSKPRCPRDRRIGGQKRTNPRASGVIQNDVAKIIGGQLGFGRIKHKKRVLSKDGSLTQEDIRMVDHLVKAFPA